MNATKRRSALCVVQYGAALIVASYWHRGQRYDKDKSYLYHLRICAAVAREFGFVDVSTQVACLFHDILEDTKCTVAFLRRFMILFGVPLTALDAVIAVTDGAGANRAERKRIVYQRLKGFQLGLCVKLSDRIGNVRENILTHNPHFSLYRKEQPHLQSELRDSRMTALEPMWDHLNQLLSSDNA